MQKCFVRAAADSEPCVATLLLSPQNMRAPGLVPDACTLKVLQSLPPQSQAESLQLRFRTVIARAPVKRGPRCRTGMVPIPKAHSRHVDSIATRKLRAIGQIHAKSAFFGWACMRCLQPVDV
jgi:hypothetical protein